MAILFPRLIRVCRAVAGTATATFIAACSPLALVNGLVPTDGLVIENDLVYGQAARHRLDVYRTSGPDHGRPIVVFFYGGSWQNGARQDYVFAAQALAQRGFVAIVPDYRVHPEVRFPAFMEDAAAVVRWARDHGAAYGGNPSRLFLMGHSAGAHIAALLGLDARYLTAQAMAPAELAGVIGLAGPYDFLPLTSRRLQEVFGQHAGVDLALTQPINFVGSAPRPPPFLLATGDDDSIVYPRNTIRLSQRLRDAGATVVEAHYDGVGHYTILLALAQPTRRLAPVLDDVNRFIRAQ